MEAGDVSRDEVRAALKLAESVAQCCIALARRGEEAVVSREPASDLPDAFGGIEFGRVPGKAMEFDFVPVLAQPLFARLVEPVAGAVVDDQEYAPRRVLGDELPEEGEEGCAVEDFREAVSEVSVFERDSAENVSRLALSEGIDAGLMAYAGPGLMESSVEPETRLVLEEDNASATGSFFFIAGNRSRIQYAWASRSARASRFLGRCTEKPIWLSRRGT